MPKADPVFVVANDRAMPFLAETISEAPALIKCGRFIFLGSGECLTGDAKLVRANRSTWTRFVDRFLRERADGISLRPSLPVEAVA